MNFIIKHETRDQLRLQADLRRMSVAQADLLEAYLQGLSQVDRVTVHERTCGVILRYHGSRGAILEALSRFRFAQAEKQIQILSHSGRELNREFQGKLLRLVALRYIKKLYLPRPIRIALCICKAVPYALRALRCLLRGQLHVELLDGVAITAAVLTGDYDTADSVMFLLHLGELLEQWTRKKSLDNLARSMALNVTDVWLRTDSGTDVQVPISQVQEGDRIVVDMGSLIPLDGEVLEGEAMVNQASLTGESLPVEKRPGTLVYAGTVLEEGRCVIRVTRTSGVGKYDQIVQMIEASERLKSGVQNRAENLADKLVPYSLGTSALTYLLTRNVTRAISVLMVDFSCVLKLAIPLSVLSAMREAGGHKITVKGGKYLEAVSQARTIVFDKTGTLTKACPVVVDVVPFSGRSKQEMLRLAACLEEHFPHSMANAVVAAAREQGLDHEEMHSQVEYLVAHGIASTVDGARTIIGSSHFVFEDEQVQILPEDKAAFDALPDRYSQLYLAIDGILSAVILISDPLRPEARQAVELLHQAGFDKVVMLTGDSARTARAVAAEVGVDDYQAEVLPEDKASFIQAEQAKGRKVVMIGDGINDAPALSYADVGVAIGTGAAIAREVADVTISAEDLRELAFLKNLADLLMRRIHRNYRFVLGFNGGLIGLGALGILPPATSALLHNSSTLALSLNSMTNLVRQE